MERYGYLEEQREGYPVAAWIWGHRLRVGQHWMEYLLEFLNVLAGFDYELGQGINTDGASVKTEYARFTRLGLRRFVFYDDWEKTRHPFDDAARKRLEAALRQLCDGPIRPDEDPLMLARSLLRAFSAVEESRSWFAKSLFPAHHNLLFWEGLRKGATKFREQRSADALHPHQLDADVSFDARNFFARGGEVYYLILSAGTRNAPALRQTIADRLRDLLKARNEALGELAAIIDQTWQQQVGDHSNPTPTGRLGWIPDPDYPLYARIAEDVATFLQADLDPLETLDLLAHLVGFHLTLYIYHRAHPQALSAHGDGRCLERCRPCLPIDALEGADGGVVRTISMAAFREQEAHIICQAQAYIRAQVAAWVDALTPGADPYAALDSEARAHFDLPRLSKGRRDAFSDRVNALIRRLGAHPDRTALSEGYADILIGVLQQDFDKNFKGVHRKLAKAVGLAAPRKGPGARFVLGDNLLKALTLANIPPGDGMTYDEFLQRLYERYGLVVGVREAREASLLERQRVNGEYFERNRAALLEKMKHAGLATEYSDATAVVGG
ncbi:MAG TPA: hypothetical protein PLN71_09285 [Anaerolineae bacterium]|nr:hypothetical protein [Anaerolineae bacterium]